MSLLTDLDDLRTAAQAAFSAAGDAAALENVRVEFLGTRGKLKAMKGRMGEVSKEEKPAVGKKMNELGVEIEAAFEAAKTRLASSAATAYGDTSSREILRQERFEQTRGVRSKDGQGIGVGFAFSGTQFSGKSLTSIEEITQKKFPPLEAE